MRSTGRTWPLTIVAGLLALAGASSIVYGGFLPMPPVSDVPMPLAWQVFGVMELAAAVGVFRLQAWGRGLGLFVATVGLVETIFLAVTRVPTSSPLGMTVDVVLSGAYAGSILWVLLRRWPARG
jgi:hypothetical protein